MKRPLSILFVATFVLPLSTTACGSESGGDNPPPQALIDEARESAEAAVEAADAARTVLEVLGILPVYTCGEPRRTFVGRIASDYQAQVSCVTATARPAGADGDEIVLDFASGCTVEGHQLSGQAVFAYSGGESRLDLALDVSSLQVDGRSLDAAGGYGTCSDETRYWASATGALPGSAGTTFALDLTVASRTGPPIIGGTTLLVDGSGTIVSSAGTDTVTATTLEYELGERFPKSGNLHIETASGHSVSITFTEVLWSLGQAEIVVDDHDPVTVPIAR